MRVSLEDRVVAVTGAASGIGAAIARCAASAGATLLLTDRDADGLARVAAETGGARSIVADLADPDAPAAIVRAALEAHGRIDALVNAAGRTDRMSVARGDAAGWDALMDVNARAPFLLMGRAIEAMRAGRHDAGRGGAIVNIGSMHAHAGAPELAAYAASKGALATLTRNAAHAHMAERIRVNAINLGWVATEAEHRMQADVLGQGEDWQARAAATQPLRRLVTADEAARLTVFLLSAQSEPLTGAVIDLEQWVAGAPPPPPPPADGIA